MRIRIKVDGQNINLVLPTGLVFGKGTVWLANHVGRKYAGDAMKNIPPKALEVLFSEFRRIKRKRGSWNLVEVESSDGEQVLITL